MLKSLFHCTIILAGAAVAAPRAARADDLPSLIRHTALTADWTVKKTSPASKGKCKIYLTEPKYGEKNEIETSLEAELKESGDSYTFSSGGVSSGGKSFWIVFYPKVGNVKVQLEFIRGKDTKSKATLLVNGLFAADTWGKGPDITFSKSSSKAGEKAQCDKDNFRKGNTFLSREPLTFLSLD